MRPYISLYHERCDAHLATAIQASSPRHALATAALTLQSHAYSAHSRQPHAHQLHGDAMAAPAAEPRVTTLSDVLSADTPVAHTALVLLNIPLCQPAIQLLWRACSLRLCADGASSRLYDMQFDGACEGATAAGSRLIPDVITGDMDSARPEVRAVCAWLCVFVCVCVHVRGHIRACVCGRVRTSLPVSVGVASAVDTAMWANRACVVRPRRPRTVPPPLPPHTPLRAA